MNQQQATQTLLDPEWIVAVGEELDSNPAAIAMSVEPNVMGAYDCQLGLVCDPRARGYVTLGDCELYRTAYYETQAAMLVALGDTFDYDGALQELVDGMEDIEFWRTM